MQLSLGSRQAQAAGGGAGAALVVRKQRLVALGGFFACVEQWGCCPEARQWLAAATQVVAGTQDAANVNGPFSPAPAVLTT